jgi:SAM-dependent methyltransferase
MHAAAKRLMRYARDVYADRCPSRRVLDVGSRDRNGTYRDLFAGWEYVGLDIEPGPGVDYVPEDPYRWIGIRDAAFGLAITGSCLEHVEYPWETMREIARVLQPGGLLFAVAPSAGPIHRVPLDCYRYAPDGLRALASWAGLEVLHTHWDRESKWRDVLLVAQKPPIETEET